MSRVLVLDQQRRPLMPCTPARARLLLKQKKAAVWRRYPFTLILRVARPDAIVQPLRLKIDPGSRTSGLAVTNDRREKWFGRRNSPIAVSKSTQPSRNGPPCAGDDACGIRDTASRVSSIADGPRAGLPRRFSVARGTSRPGSPA